MGIDVPGVREPGSLELVPHVFQRCVVGRVIRPGALTAGGEWNAEALEGFVEGSRRDRSEAFIVDQEEEVGGEGVAVPGNASEPLEEGFRLVIAGEGVEEPSLDRARASARSRAARKTAWAMVEGP